MKFGDTPVDRALGAVLAHGVRAGKAIFKKGRVLAEADIATLRAAGIASVVAARFEPGDVTEDEAARRIAAALQGERLTATAPFTGRCNLYAEARGIAVIDRARLDRLNLLDEAVTVATVPPYDTVEPRQMVATIKIIPFAVPEKVVQACEAVARDGGPMLRVAPFRQKAAALIQTTTDGFKPRILDNTADATRQRLESLGGSLRAEARCAHRTEALAQEIAQALRAEPDLLLISGASAITDRRDVIPAAIERAGGEVVHFGMPVDPGNLILLGRIGNRPVIGLPGCARSPKFNGFDWLLQRLMADVPVTASDIMRLGAGGLLKEIPSRPLPRAEAETPSRDDRAAAAAPRAPRIAAIVLAAGLARRMGSNKLLAPIEGVPMVARAVDAALASQARPVVVVVGNEAERVKAALAGRDVTFVANPDFAEGLSASLKRGIAAVPPECDGALVCLGDMPRVTAGDLNRLIAAFNPVEGRGICVPVRDAKRGNPVLWGRRFFAEILGVAGDVGAKHLIGAYPEAVAEVAMEGDGVLIDIDTPQALASLSAKS
ncbi:MAG: molybdopterin-binding/glycosyltransferase family 2 protein [Alphaproteobacteria bacterium]|nr:molybdopterin-binding/glycosyltransferase family 2 protein [Alphaproteobacteria bacterium]